MALNKVTYVDDVTVIHAQNLNEIQDTIGDGTLTGFTATDLTGAANELKDTLNDLVYHGAITSDLSSMNDLTTMTPGLYRVGISTTPAYFPGGYGSLEIVHIGEYAFAYFTSINTQELIAYRVSWRTSDGAFYQGGVWQPITDPTSVKKVGDTMTGNLIVSNTDPGAKLKNNTYSSTSTSYSSPYNDTGFRLLDKNDNAVAIYTERYVTDGSTGAFLAGCKKIGNDNVMNTLSLFVDKNGNRIVYGYPASWRIMLELGTNGQLPITVEQGGTGATSNQNARKNLSLAYIANDTFNVSSSFVANGCTSSNGNTVYLDVRVDKFIETGLVSSATVTTMDGRMVSVNGLFVSTDFVAGSTGSTPTYTISCTIQGLTHVRIGITKTNGWGLSDRPVAYFGTLTIKFT